MKKWKTVVGGLALHDDIVQEESSIGVDGKSLDLKGKLDNKMNDREYEVGSRESRECDPVPLHDAVKSATDQQIAQSVPQA